MRVIDLRSDTVTKPTPAMRAAMAEAEVGDDVYDEDPTVHRLEAMAAECLGAEAALFVPSGTQSNLIALMVHCARGDEFVVGQTAHTYRSEGGGAAVLGSIQPQPLDFEPDGTLDLEKVERAIKPDDPHYARTRLLCLENTQAGRVLPTEYLARAQAFARRKGLAIHLDGARLFNAAVALDQPARAIARHVDSVAFCLSKGLGAPVGSMLCGSKAFVAQARRHRKTLGGGLRQAGVLAAAGIVALRDHVDRLAEDHANAALLATGLARLDDVRVEPGPTNMVFVTVASDVAASLKSYLGERGIVIRAGSRIRLVTHLDVTVDDIRTVVGAVEAFFAAPRPGTSAIDDAPSHSGYA